jgi:hypothetical protein
MRIDVSSVTEHFTNPQDGFTTTTSGAVSSAATTVGLNSTGDYANGDIVVLIIDPADPDKKQVFVGTIDVGGSQVTGVKWAGGTNQSHASGATVVDYYDAAHIRMITKGFLAQHKQSGSHADTITTDTINENTSGNGVTIDGVTMKDGAINTAGAVGNTAVITGMPVQTVDTVSAAANTGTTVLPYDDTVPQITEGNEFMTLAITPKSATNKLVIEATVFASFNQTGNNNLVIALFQDLTAGALAANALTLTGQDFVEILNLRHVMVAGTTSVTTFKIRVGCPNAGTVTFNGAGGNRLFGAITKSSIQIVEYKA